ncbi:pitrilysin family protein [Rapidithrix thailandica]|uniref:Pitrilysin family protein n=1 Tax=Rapidithrix thailandica TaxID=413964 RepID=A0AAW9SE09_9BACT
MKYLLIYVSFCLAFTAEVVAQKVDRTQAPEPGPAPEIKIGKAERFELENGLKVIVVENHKLPRVSFNLSLDLDPVYEGKNAGYVDLAGQLLMHGTQNRSKSELDEEVDFIGASLGSSSTGVYGSALTKHTDKLLELMSDVLFNPSFPEAELDKLKKQTISGIQAGKDDPNSIASNVRSALVYGKDHPYGENATEKTVENVTVEACKKYYTTYFKPDAAYLVVVGDINRSKAEELARKYFSKWPEGEVPSHQYATPKAPAERIVALVDRPTSVQSVINVTFPVTLKVGDPDVVKTSVLNQILGGGFSSRLMQNLREDKAFTYGARSSLSSDRLIGSFNAYASVRNQVTDSAVNEFLYEIEKIVEETVTDKELKAAKAYLTGSFARSLESPSTIARFALNTALYKLPEDYYATYLQRLNAVTVEDLKSVAKKYISPEQAYVLIVGKADDYADKVARFGKVNYFDIYGDAYEPGVKTELPEGLTAQQVINSYIKAIGGEENLNKVEDVYIKMKASMQGRELDIENIRKAPNKSFSTISMNGMAVFKQVYNGSDLVMTQMGQPIEVEEGDKKDIVFQSMIFPELHMNEMGVNLELKGIEQIEDKAAYALEMEMPSGKKSTLYFDIASGLKVRTSMVVETPQGEIAQVTDFADYKEYNGVKFPQTIIMPMGPMKLEAKAASIQVNSGISDDTFKVQ